MEQRPSAPRRRVVALSVSGTGAKATLLETLECGHRLGFALGRAFYRSAPVRLCAGCAADRPLDAPPEVAEPGTGEGSIADWLDGVAALYGPAERIELARTVFPDGSRHFRALAEDRFDHHTAHGESAEMALERLVRAAAKRRRLRP